MTRPPPYASASSLWSEAPRAWLHLGALRAQVGRVFGIPPVDAVNLLRPEIERGEFMWDAEEANACRSPHGIPHRVEITRNIHDWRRRYPWIGTEHRTLIYLSVQLVCHWGDGWGWLNWEEGSIDAYPVEVWWPAVREVCNRYLTDRHRRGEPPPHHGAPGSRPPSDDAAPVADDRRTAPPPPSAAEGPGRPARPQTKAPISLAALLRLLRSISEVHRREHGEPMRKPDLLAAARLQEDFPDRAFQAAYGDLDLEDRFTRGRGPRARRSGDAS